MQPFDFHPTTRVIWGENAFSQLGALTKELGGRCVLLVTDLNTPAGRFELGISETDSAILWILHLGLGKDFLMQDEFGNSIKLCLLGGLQSSIFQSEIPLKSIELNPQNTGGIEMLKKLKAN